MHVVDDVPGLRRKSRTATSRAFVVVLDLLVVQGAVGFREVTGSMTPLLMTCSRSSHPAAVDGVQQGLCGVHASVAKNCICFAHAHRGDAACDGSVVAPVVTNFLVGPVLDGGGVDGDLGAEALVAFGSFGSQKMVIIARARSEVLQGQGC